MRNNYTFRQGVMDQDSDPRLIEKGKFIEAVNCRVTDSGIVSKAPGTMILAYGIVPDGHTVIGAKKYEDNIYYFSTDNNSSVIGRYNVVTGEITTLVRSFQLNFSTNHPIDFINFIDDELNGKFFVYWTDGLNQPRRIEVNDVASRPSVFIV